MRCRVCNAKLNPSECVRKDYQTNQFLDTCSVCLYSAYDSMTSWDYDFPVSEKPIDKDE